MSVQNLFKYTVLAKAVIKFLYKSLYWSSLITKIIKTIFIKCNFRYSVPRQYTVIN